MTTLLHQPGQPGQTEVPMKISGASDDLVELDGAICEEFQVYDSDGALLGCSDGTLLRIVYTPQGTWRITPVAAGSAGLHIDQAPEDDEVRYSDIATLTPAAGQPIVWVVCGGQMAKAKAAK